MPDHPFQILVRPVGPFVMNCYLVFDPDSREAIVIDPGDQPYALLEDVKEKKLSVRYLLNTHGHIDHAGRVQEFKTALEDFYSSRKQGSEGRMDSRLRGNDTEESGKDTDRREPKAKKEDRLEPSNRGRGPKGETQEIPYLIHQADQFWLDKLPEQALAFGLGVFRKPKPTAYIQEGDEFSFGPFKARAIHTPGHTAGGICFLIEKVLFSGDVLFKQTIGRTDFPQGSHPQLIQSIREKLLPLPEETQVYPGHGESTTIGFEKRFNPFLSAPDGPA